MKNKIKHLVATLLPILVLAAADAQEMIWTYWEKGGADAHSWDVGAIYPSWPTHGSPLGWIRQVQTPVQPIIPTVPEYSYPYLGFQCTQEAGARLFADIETAVMARSEAAVSEPLSVELTVTYYKQPWWALDFLPASWRWKQMGRRTVEGALHIARSGLFAHNLIEVADTAGAELIWEMTAYDYVTLSTHSKIAGFIMDGARETVMKVLADCPAIDFRPE